MISKPIPYGKQDITEEDIQQVITILKSDFLTQGPTIELFEKKFAEYVGCNYAVAVVNGTAALHLSTLALNVNESSHVITTPITFVASANCVRYAGGTVHFSDVKENTILLDIEKTRKLIESKPNGFFNGIVVVDFAGYPVNLEEYRKLADEYGLWIIEDACHSVGGYFIDSKGQKQYCGNGNFADLSVFSFHPVKHIATGEGGMITTNQKELYEKLILLRTHGITKNPTQLTKNDGGWYQEMQVLGFNYRIPDILAGLGISQLSRIENNIKQRNEIAKKYNDAFKNVDIRLLPSFEKGRHAYHLYIIQTKKRKELYDFLRTKNIFSQVHYVPAHLMPYYQQFGWKKGDLPVAENYYDQCLSLPIYSSLQIEEQDYVIENVKLFFK